MFPDSNFYIKRPSRMPQGKFKQLRASQNRRLKNYLNRGTLLYKAVEILKIPVDPADPKSRTIDRRKTYPPFVGNVRRTLFKTHA